MRIETLLISCALAFTTLSAHAFERPFPPGTKRGVMTPATYPSIVIDGKTRRLAPGARIWNQENRIQMPASLSDGDYTVHYTENGGDIDRVWILTPAEIERPAPKPLPAPAGTN